MRKLKMALAIPTYNREKVLVDTLRGCFVLRPKPDEILVVDQTPSHEEATRRFLEDAHRSGKIRLVLQKTPNAPMARNRALRETGCEVVVFIDDDVVLPKSFIRDHARNYKDPKTDGVAGRVKQDAQHPIPKFGPKGGWPRVLDSLYFPFDSNKRIEGIATFRGCNHSVRVKKVLALGGYDENYIGSAVGEEVDMAIRLWDSGGKIVYDPKVWLFHLVAPSGGTRVYGPMKKPIPEWAAYFPVIYFSSLHHFPSLFFWYLTLWANVRLYVFRKLNRERPWRIPWALVSYAYALFRALFLARRRRRGKGLRRTREALSQLSAFERKMIFAKVRGLFGKRGSK